MHRGPGRPHRGARLLRLQRAVGQRVPAAGHDCQRCFHVRPAVHNGRSVAELRQ